MLIRRTTRTPAKDVPKPGDNNDYSLGAINPDAFSGQEAQILLAFNKFASNLPAEIDVPHHWRWRFIERAAGREAWFFYRACEPARAMSFAFGDLADVLTGFAKTEYGLEFNRSTAPVRGTVKAQSDANKLVFAY